MNFDQASKLTNSEKITLLTVEAVERAKIFTDEGSGIYSRVVSNFVVKMKNGTSLLTQVSSTPTNNNEFYYNPTEGKVYVKLNENPKLKNLSITYRFFYSTASVNLPCDLSMGTDVNFDARIESVGSVGQQLDEENIGIVLESQSNAQLINSDGYFDDIFDTLIWENQEVKFYSWIYGTPISEIKKIFDGVVESKDFGQDRINLKVRDFVFRLQNQVNLDLFTEEDGNLSPSIIGTPKRRIYGRVEQAKLVALDSVLGGYSLTGTISGDAETVIITGTGTQFLKELSPDDEIFFTVNGEEEKVGIQSVDSDTQITVSSELDFNIVSMSNVRVSPRIPYRFKNRVFHLAGHKLRAPTATIQRVLDSNKFEVDTTQDFETGTQVEINGDLVTIRRISGNIIVTQSAVSPRPSESDQILRLPVNNVFFGPRELIYSRDWTVSNTTECKITFNALAEFNATEQRTLSPSFVFTNGSRTITTSAVTDLRSILKSRDWIRKNSVTDVTWHEILQVNEQSVILRTAYSGTTQTTTANVKIVEYINDDALILANSLGMEALGVWIRRPAEAVRHLVLNDAQFSSVNESKFTEAVNDCDYTLSMVIPDSVGEQSPKIKDVITKINQSVFGSLYGDSAFNVSYSIMNAEKPEDTEILRDDDIISWESNSTQRIVNKVKINYSPFVDKFNGSDALKTIEFNNGFVDSLIGINNTLERTLYLYEDDKAEIIAQRLALFNSLSSTVVTVKAKLNLALKAVGDKMFLSLDRLYKRYGGKDKRKIGTITGIKKNGYDTDVTFVDLANVYNRVPAIAPNSTLDYSAGISDDYVRFGHIVDNDTESPDVTSEMQLGNNLIG